MPITAKQTKNANWNFDVVQERLLRASGGKAPIYANVRTDTDEVLGYSTDRYGIVQNDDLLGRAESAFASRGINYERNVYATDNGAKMRAVYDLTGDQFQTKVPQVGDIMGYRLTVQNSFDRTLRVSFALGLMRLVCTNGMQTMQKDVDMVSKHSQKLDLDSLITDAALDKALGFLSKSGDVFGQLAATPLDDELGLNVLANLTKKKVMSEKVRERVAGIWSNRSDLLRSDNHDANLYNLYNAVTQHLTDEVEETRFEYANRMSNQVLKAFERSAGSQAQFAKLTKAIPVVDSEVVVTE
tara:strand:- start:2448 stop:3344 length:897 start_codon:yes stop_codon:yes gene_type:complete